MLFRTICFVSTMTFMSFSFADELTKFNLEFSKLVESQLHKYSIPGGAYVIVKNNKVFAIETFGHTDKSKAQKVNNNTVFRLASVSKTFASTITTMLAQEQVLNLSDPITKYVPQFTLAQNGAAEKIQIKHLLSHSAGLMPNAYDNLLHENWSIDKIIGRFDRITPICKPEQCYGYQNIAYSLLQPAIENSQDKSYAALLDERVFEPLNMHNTSIGFKGYQQAKITAKPHVLRKKIDTGKKDENGNKIKQYIWRTVDVEDDFYKVAPAAGVNSSITDLSQWLIANLGYKPAVLSTSLLTELTTPRIKTKKELRRRYWKKYLSDAHYGYGWRIYQFADTPIMYHSGWVKGFRADIGYSPELDIGFALLINAESNVINQLSSQFWAQTSQLIKENTKQKI